MSSIFSKKRKSTKQNDEISLQITSMADIFTILLVFLLKGYAAGALQISPSPGVRIPAAQGVTLNEEALQVEVSETAIQVSGNVAAKMEKFNFLDGQSETLQNAFEKESKRRTIISQANDQVKNDGKMIVVADERVPYSTLKVVLRTAAANGFNDLRLAVIKE